LLSPRTMSVFLRRPSDLAKRCIIDGLGVMVAGMREPSVQIVREYVHAAGGVQESTLLGRGKERAPAHLAALVNGIAGHAMDWDDTALSTTPDRACFSIRPCRLWQRALR